MIKRLLHKCIFPLWFLLLVVFLAVPVFPAPTVYQGTVVGITDGDTIVVLGQGETLKVRLAEIDAPEKSQAFGNQSKKALSDMLFGKAVHVVGQDRDRYERLVGTVYVGDLNANAEMVRRGMAWVYLRYARDPALFEIEGEAKRAKRGLWVDPHAMPPWEYRHRGNGSSPTPAIETPRAAAEPIIGNRKSKIYHWPGCPGYHAVAPKNQVLFTSRTEAAVAGFRAAQNCRNASFLR